jgi:hypothetical protein
MIFLEFFGDAVYSCMYDSRDPFDAIHELEFKGPKDKFGCYMVVFALDIQ